MMRALALLLIGFVFGGGAGFVLGTSQSGAPEEVPVMDHSEHQHVHGEGLEMDAGTSAPTLAIDLRPDPVAGWNLHIRTSNFVFAAERAGEAHVPGEGHAHVYVNGEKVARAYGDWFHLDNLPAGPVELEVTLTSNDHRSLIVEGSPLSATLSFNNPG